MAGSAVDDIGAPDSWEVADLDAAVSRLMLSSSSGKVTEQPPKPVDPSPSSDSPASGSCSAASSTEKTLDDLINHIDPFLRDAIQNPRERLSILRMEQDVEKFIRDPTEQQIEFQQLPTSYLRLAAHRVAQHYLLQSMVLMDSNLPDAVGSRIIVRKTSESRLPAIRLADIPVNLPLEDCADIKVAIKQRPQNRHVSGNSNSNSAKTNNCKSVEERKEDYNRARARIFNSNMATSDTHDTEAGLQESSKQVSLQDSQPASIHDSRHGSCNDSQHTSQNGSSNWLRNGGSSNGSQHGSENQFQQDCKHGTRHDSKQSFRHGSHHSSSGVLKVEDKSAPEASNINSISRRTEEPDVRYTSNNRVAIFRDRETDRRDPDYDRSYERYLQRFDPGFGFNNGPYTLQPMFTPALTYNSDFPQLGSTHMPQIYGEHHHPRPLLQHLPGPWIAHSTHSGISYGHPETIMPPFTATHVGLRPPPAMYMHSPQFPGHGPGMPFIRAHGHVHHPFAQSYQQQPDASFGFARPR